MIDRAKDRGRMVARQLARRGITNVHVLRAMGEVPREAFVAEALKAHAYADTPLPIEAGQTISQPFIVAYMIDEAELAPYDRVLEIGAGSGYAAAVMSRIAARVFAIERQDILATLARERLQRLGYDNVDVRTGDGTRGWPEAAPFDAIVASAGAPAVPEVVKRQLQIGGVLVIPIGAHPHVQRLVKVRRTGEATFEALELGQVRFVPLIGEHGWAGDDRG